MEGLKANRIYTGDARELAEQIPNETIDLVFTDPVYGNIEDYRWTAKTARRILRPDRACLVFGSTRWTREYRRAMDLYLDYIYTLNYIVTAKTTRLREHHLFTWRTPLLWFNKGSFAPNPWVPDTVISGKKKAFGFKWNKNPEALMNWMRAFCPPGGTVVDFFCGGGTTAIVASLLGLKYICFEIYPVVAQMARERVAAAARTLPGLEYHQPSLYKETPDDPNE